MARLAQRVRLCPQVITSTVARTRCRLGVAESFVASPGIRIVSDISEWKPITTCDRAAHAAIGADLLDGDDSDLMRMARDIAHTHHEKWDGSGYPNGLSETDIPIEGRITAIADVFDAIASIFEDSRLEPDLDDLLSGISFTLDKDYPTRGTLS